MDTVLIIGAVVGGVCTVLAAVGSLIVSLRTSDKVEEKAKAADLSAKAQDESLTQIHTLVNSQLTNVTDRLKASEAQLAGMNLQMLELKKSNEAQSIEMKLQWLELKKEVAVLKGMIAKLTGDPLDIAKSEQADAEVTEAVEAVVEAKQDSIDAEGTPDAEEGESP